MSTIIFYGILSAYALNPTVATINYRQAIGQLPADLSPYAVYLAVDDCNLIGHEATMTAGDEIFHGIIFDCTGSDGTQYFADGNVEYDEPWRMLAADADAMFWEKRPDIVRTLVMIEVEATK